MTGKDNVAERAGFYRILGSGQEKEGLKES